jgi:[pyruvate, water dikinase]-phosphate phosphotransferase / [pyruvate, water dikinase] kinase
MLTIFVVSDATAETAERMVRAALIQFPDAPATIARRTGVATAKKVRDVVHEAASAPSFIFHTLVSGELRRVMLSECRHHAVDAMDLMGPMLARLGTRLGLAAQEKPGIFRQLTEEKSREIEAVAYAFHHDDGQQADQLDRAEVVLVGPSRTMKTPTMLYLTYRGWFCANIPLIPDVPPPPSLLALRPERVFCLMMQAARMRELRVARIERAKIPGDVYASREEIRRETEYARRLSAERGWRPIDVTGKSVEEVAREIITLLSGDARACQGW